MKKWHDYITERYYVCTKEVLSGLGEMYVTDERLKENIDKHGVDTAESMAVAVRIYC